MYLLSMHYILFLFFLSIQILLFWNIITLRFIDIKKVPHKHSSRKHTFNTSPNSSSPYTLENIYKLLLPVKSLGNRSQIKPKYRLLAIKCLHFVIVIRQLVWYVSRDRNSLYFYCLDGLTFGCILKP